MFRNLLVAASIALGAFGGLAVTAPAEAGVRIYLGVPFHPYQVGPGWRYHDGYGWYDYGRYGAFRPAYRDPYYARKMTCNQARRLVDRSGYNNVDARDCSGRTYSFRATRNGKRHTVYVNAYNGNIWR